MNFKDLFRSPAVDYTFGQIGDDSSRSPIEKNQKYLSVILRSMRIIHSRRGWSKFYPVVHSYFSLPHHASRLAEFQVVTSPTRLAELDPNRLDRIITLNQRLLGPIPYRGGDLTAEIGLLSVKTSDLAKPYLNLLETMATAAGVSFVSVAQPFIGPLKKGLELLTESSDLGLEVGLATNWTEPVSGNYAVIGAKRGTYQTSSMRIADDLRLVDEFGRAIEEHPYFVFGLECSDSRDDWFQIPDISEIHSQLREAVQKARTAEAEEFFATFKRTALTSPDLLFKHSQKLVAEIQSELSEIMPATMTGSTRLDLRPLNSISLF
jgi:hypothetical protein